MRSEDASFTITTTNNNDYYAMFSSPDDLPLTVTRKTLRQFILEILKEKGLLQEDNQ